MGYNVRDKLPDAKATDDRLRIHWRERWHWLTKGHGPG
jgi:hypothetical protein